MQVSKLINLVLYVAIGITVILAVFTLQALQSKKALPDTNKPALFNVFFPYKADTSNFRYYNGNTFVRYDNTTDRVIPLTQYVSLYDIQNVHWYQNGVVFNTSAIGDTSDLYKAFNAFTSQYNGITFDEIQASNVYWNLSFKTGELAPLGPFTETTINGSVTEDGGFVFDNIDSIAKISADGIINRNYSPLFSIDEIKILRLNNGVVYYAKNEDDTVSLNKYEVATQKTTRILNSIHNSDSHTISEPIYMLDDDSIFYLEPSGTSGNIGLSDIVSKNIKDKNSRIIASDVQGFFEKSASDELVFIHLAKNVVDLKLISKGGDTENYRVPSKNKLVTSAISSAGDLIYFDSSGKAYNISQNRKSREGYTEAIEPGFKSTNSSLTRNIFEPNDNSYTLTVASGSVKNELDRVYKYIESKNLNPYEFTITTIRGQNASD